MYITFVVDQYGHHLHMICMLLPNTIMYKAGTAVTAFGKLKSLNVNAPNR